MIKTKPLRAPAEPSDGTRVYIGRRYPRGIKDGILWNERIHDLGPSLDLHQAVLHGGLPIDRYKERFLAEMEEEGPRRLVQALAERSQKGETITLLCDHPKAIADDECHRFLVKRLVDARTKRRAKA